ncbi:hypothetical protein Q8A67_022096 [Cirrhinus molitorella]|uniref:Uncharacterized protein n=1 Tax=Cirrhinus molitorella TaxID=172907 RepID=A0AA88P796_9TELE|nr:hypothetical protein Q8A67_022096 [Cirrhinus molitorella]
MLEVLTSAFLQCTLGQTHSADTQSLLSKPHIRPQTSPCLHFSDADGDCFRSEHHHDIVCVLFVSEISSGC